MLWRCAIMVLLQLGTVAPVMGQTSNEPPRASFGQVIVVVEPERLQPPLKALPPTKQPTPPRMEGTLFYPLQLTPPDPGRLFVLEAEDVFRNRMRQEAHDRGVRHPLEFPTSTLLPATRETPRSWNAYIKIVEPSYVISGRLLWEQPLLERHGVSLGVLQPGISTGLFFIDTVNWPIHRLARPFIWNQLNVDRYSPSSYLIGAQERSWGIESLREPK